MWRWFDRNFLELGREMRLSYLPPLMVYVAAGLQGLTAIIISFFVKDYLDLSAQFLAALGFWVMLPWTLKMPLGHLVDLIWKHKAGLVYLGASLIAAGLLIMIGLLSDRAAMTAVMPAGAWYVLSALLAPIGYVLQDVVADAMTVEAVPRVDEAGKPIAEEQRRLGHTTMQTLGRVAIIGGAFLVSIVNVLMFSGVETMSAADKVAVYLRIYHLALIIPVVSVLGTVMAGILRQRHARRLATRGFDREQVEALLHGQRGKTPVNWWILGGGLIFAMFSVSMGLGPMPFYREIVFLAALAAIAVLLWRLVPDRAARATLVGASLLVLGLRATTLLSPGNGAVWWMPFNQEIIFLGSFAIVVFLMWRLVRELEPAARATLVGTALVIFVFRAATLVSPGPGATWWSIDVLGFDQQFVAKLETISSGLTLIGMFLFRRFMAERPIAYIVAFLTIVGTLLALPNVGMYYGLHHWTAAHTGGVVDARFIALVNTAVESPLGQVAMIPMLAWIANSAPERLKATYFAVMASFTNLALSLGQLGTKYLNSIYTVAREVKDPVTGLVTAPADYSQLGHLFITALVIGFVLPMLAVLIVRTTRWRSS